MNQSFSFKQLEWLCFIAFIFCSVNLLGRAETTFGGAGGPDIVEVNSPVSAATGASSITMFDGSSAMIGNPAVLTKLKKSAFQVGASAALVSEETLSEGKLKYENSQTYPNPLRTQSAIVRYQKFVGGISRGLVGDYTFKRESRVDKKDPKSDLITVERTGGLYLFSAHLAMEAIPKLSVGGSLNLLRGSGESEYLRKGKTSSGVTSEFSEDSGVSITLGGSYQVHDKVNLAAAYRSGTEIKLKLTAREIRDGKAGDSDTEIIRWQYPSSFGGGATYEYEDILFIGEIHQVKWSDYTIQDKDDIERPDYLDLTTYHVGVEYRADIPDISSEPVRLRAGFYTAPFYFIGETRDSDFSSIEYETKGYFLTAGVGIFLDVVQLDISARYGRKTLMDFDGDEEYEGSIGDIFATLTYQTDFEALVGKTKTP